MPKWKKLFFLYFFKCSRSDIVIQYFISKIFNLPSVHFYFFFFFLFFFTLIYFLFFLFFFTPFLSSYPSRVSCFFSFSSVSFSTFSLASFFCSFFSSSVLYFSTFLSTKLYVLGLKVYCGESFRVFVVLKSGQFSYSFSTNLPCSAHLIKHNACEVFIRIPAVMETPEV